MFTRKATQVWDNLNPNWAIAVTQIPGMTLLMLISLRKTEHYYMQCFIIFAFILFFFLSICFT